MSRAEERLLNPPPGGRIEAARAHGVDLTLLVERLRKTPEERVRDLQRAAAGLEAVRGKGLKASRVPFVSVGGLALTIHGSSCVPFDLDFCYPRDRENLSRLAQALGPYHPR